MLSFSFKNICKQTDKCVGVNRSCNYLISWYTPIFLTFNKNGLSAFLHGFISESTEF